MTRPIETESPTTQYGYSIRLPQLVPTRYQRAGTQDATEGASLREIGFLIGPQESKKATLYFHYLSSSSLIVNFLRHRRSIFLLFIVVSIALRLALSRGFFDFPPLHNRLNRFLHILDPF